MGRVSPFMRVVLVEYIRTTPYEGGNLLDGGLSIISAKIAVSDTD